jgi:hypothetical protein
MQGLHKRNSNFCRLQLGGVLLVQSAHYVRIQMLAISSSIWLVVVYMFIRAAFVISIVFLTQGMPMT